MKSFIKVVFNYEIFWLLPSMYWMPEEKVFGIAFLCFGIIIDFSDDE